jgi:hypothetical protein
MFVRPKIRRLVNFWSMLTLVPGLSVTAGIRKGSKLGRPYSLIGLFNWLTAFWIAEDRQSLKLDFLLSHLWNVEAGRLER